MQELPRSALVHWEAARRRGDEQRGLLKVSHVQPEGGRVKWKPAIWPLWLLRLSQ
jgi:hypothetical protein